MAGMLHSNSGIKPPRLENCKTFGTFKKAIDLWRQVSGIPEEQQGIVVALSLPAQCDFGENLGNKIIENIPTSKLNSTQGLDLVIAFLDKELSADSSTELIKRWNDFFYLSRDETQTLDEYIEKFERTAEHLKEAGQDLSDQVKGVELMRKLGLKSNERKIVQGLVDFNKNKDEVYEAMKEQTKLFLQKSNDHNNTRAKNSNKNVGVMADFVKVAPASQVPVFRVNHGGYSAPPPPLLQQSFMPNHRSYPVHLVSTNSQFQGGRGRSNGPPKKSNNQNNGPKNTGGNNNNKNPKVGAKGGKNNRGGSVPHVQAHSQKPGGSKDKAPGSSNKTQTIVVHVNAVSK